MCFTDYANHDVLHSNVQTDPKCSNSMCRTRVIEGLLIPERHTRNRVALIHVKLYESRQRVDSIRGEDTPLPLIRH